MRAFGAFKAKRLFSEPPSPICDRKGVLMTNMQDQIRPPTNHLKASPKHSTIRRSVTRRNRCRQSEMARSPLRPRENHPQQERPAKDRIDPVRLPHSSGSTAILPRQFLFVISRRPRKNTWTIYARTCPSSIAHRVLRWRRASPHLKHLLAGCPAAIVDAK